MKRCLSHSRRIARRRLRRQEARIPEGLRPMYRLGKAFLEATAEWARAVQRDLIRQAGPSLRAILEEMKKGQESA